MLGACTLLAASSAVSRASAQTAPPPPGPAAVSPPTGSHKGIHYGVGVAAGLGGVGDRDSVGPWLEGAFSLDVGLSSAAYVRLEPGLVWTSSHCTDCGQQNMRDTPVNGLAPGVGSTIDVWQFAFIVRSTIGIDLGPWFTVRAGPVLGAVSTHLSSELCSDSSLGFAAGATVTPEIRFGPGRRIELGPQLDLVWMHSSYCVYVYPSNPADPYATVPYVTAKPTFNLLLHAAVHFW
jgi:hypothetical protein